MNRTVETLILMVSAAVIAHIITRKIDQKDII